MCPNSNYMLPISSGDVEFCVSPSSRTPSRTIILRIFCNAKKISFMKRWNHLNSLHLCNFSFQIGVFLESVNFFDLLWINGGNFCFGGSMNVMSLDAEISQLSVVHFTSPSLNYGATSTRRYHVHTPYKGSDAAERRFYDLKYSLYFLRKFMI